MYALERLTPGVADSSPARIELGPAGLLLVSEVRPYHRNQQCAVVALQESTVSSGPGGHCRIWISAEEVWVVDGGSDNGTWVTRDGTVLASGNFRSPVRARAGDIIGVGRVQYRLIEDNAARESNIG